MSSFNKKRVTQQEIEEYKRNIEKYDYFFGEENYQKKSGKEDSTCNGHNNSAEGYYTSDGNRNNLRNKIFIAYANFVSNGESDDISIGAAVLGGIVILLCLFLICLLPEMATGREDIEIGLLFYGMLFLVVILSSAIHEIDKIKDKIAFQKINIEREKILGLVTGSIFLIAGLIYFFSTGLAEKIEPILIPLIFLISGLITTALSVYGTIVKQRRCTVEVEAVFCGRAVRRGNSRSGTSYTEFYEYTYMDETYTKSIRFTGWLFLNYRGKKLFYINPDKPTEVYYREYPLQILSGIFIIYLGVMMLCSF